MTIYWKGLPIPAEPPQTAAARSTPYRAWNHPQGAASPEASLATLARTLEAKNAVLLEALKKLLECEALFDDDSPQLIAARNQAYAAIHQAESTN